MLGIFLPLLPGKSLGFTIREHWHRHWNNLLAVHKWSDRKVCIERKTLSFTTWNYTHTDVHGTGSSSRAEKDTEDCKQCMITIVSSLSQPQIHLSSSTLLLVELVPNVVTKMNQANVMRTFYSFLTSALPRWLPLSLLNWPPPKQSSAIYYWRAQALLVKKRRFS